MADNITDWIGPSRSDLSQCTHLPVNEWSLLVESEMRSAEMNCLEVSSKRYQRDQYKYLATVERFEDWDWDKYFATAERC